MTNLKFDVFVLVYAYASIISATARSCYYPDGSLTSDTPCNTTTSGHSSCCTVPCMSSGLCFDNGLMSRGSCTDPTWKDADCPQYCVNFIPNRGCPIIPRQWTDGVNVAEIGWCCDFPTSNGSCSQGFEIKVQAGTVLPNATTTSTSSSAQSPTGTASNTAAAATTSCSTSDNTNTVCPANHDAAIGAGVGIPLGLAALAFVGLFLRERMARRKEKNAYVQAPQEFSEVKSPIPSAVTAYSGATEMAHPASELSGMQRYGELPS